MKRKPAARTYPEANLLPRFLSLLRLGYSGGDLLTWLRRQASARMKAMLRNPPPPEGTLIMGTEHEVTFEYENLLRLSNALSADDLGKVEEMDDVVLRLWRCDRSQYAEEQFRLLRQDANKGKAEETDRRILGCLVGGEIYGLRAMDLPQRKRVSAINKETGIPKQTIRDSLKRLEESGQYTP